MLDTERQFFKDNQEQWKTDYPGTFALVKGEILIGAFDTMDDA